MSTFNQQEIRAGVEAVSRYLEAASSDPLVQQAHCCANGDAVGQLEEKLAGYYGKKHALCVSNATTGLYHVFKEFGVENRDVLTSALTVGASVAGVLHAGGRPILCDIETDTFGLSRDAASTAMSSNVAAILTVDLFGVPSDTEALKKVAEQHGVPLVADCAQSFGGRRDGKPAGYFADVLVTSFTARKPLFGGEGAAIVTDDTKLYRALVRSSQHEFRQKRELGLFAANPYAMNARMSPTSAVWADAMFEAALRVVHEKQLSTEGIVDALNATGLIEELSWKALRVKPSGFGIPFMWKERSQWSKLKRLLARWSPTVHEPAILPLPPSPRICPTRLRGFADDFLRSGACITSWTTKPSRDRREDACVERSTRTLLSKAPQ